MSAPGGAPVPEALAAAIEERVADQPTRALAAAADELSRRYREATAAPLPAPSRLDVDAYLTVRLPATFAAVAAVLAETARSLPDLSPASLLDVGAGPGTAAWAATAQWPDVASVTLVEQAGELAAAGRRLAAAAPGPSLRDATWLEGDLGAVALPSADVVIAAFVLVELTEARRLAALARLWDAAGDVLVVVEPGTPAAAAGVLALRRALVDRGATIVAPCPHDGPCPYDTGEPDTVPGAGAGAHHRPVPGGAPGWCHASVRLARSRRHRQVKGGAAGFEDERFTYLVAVRGGSPLTAAAQRATARVLAPPVRRGGRIELVVCAPDGIEHRAVRTRDGGAPLRRTRWGDGLDRS